jgi:hypothetical protein
LGRSFCSSTHGESVRIIAKSCKQMANFSNSQHFRRIPDLLPVWYPLVFVTLGHLMDWISTSFLAHACWRIDGAHLRCWLFPCLVECRVVRRCLRLHDVIALYNILAGHSRARNLRRSRCWMLVCPIRRHFEYLLQHKNCYGYGSCCSRK